MARNDKRSDTNSNSSLAALALFCGLPFPLFFACCPLDRSCLLSGLNLRHGKAALSCLDKSPYGLKDIDYVIPHQANERITRALAKKLGLPMGKFCVTIDRYGNTSGSSVAIAMDKAVKGEIKGYHIERGKRILLTGVGGGYTLSGMVIDY